MATYQKRLGAWRVQVRIRGVSESRTFATKAAATAWAAERETELRQGVAGASSRKTLRDALETFERDVAPTRRGARWEIIRLRKLAREMACVDLPLRDLTPDHLGQWRDQALRYLSADSVRREMALLSTVLHTARMEWRWIASNPVRDMRKPAPGRARTQLISDDARERLCLALGYQGCVLTRSHQVAEALLFALETAMRAGEILSLRWEDVDFQTRVARLRITKNGDPRDVPLSRRAVALIGLMPKTADTVWTVGAQTRDALFRRAVADSGCVGLRFHDSRATALTRMARLVDVMTLAKISGHRDLNQLLRAYYRESAASISKRLAAASDEAAGRAAKRARSLRRKAASGGP